MQDTRTIEVKNGKKWDVSFIETENVHSNLSTDLIAKKIDGCTWIKSIRNTYHGNGTRTILVDYGNGTRARYFLHK